MVTLTQTKTGMNKVANIDRVWEIFAELNQIARPSHHEEKVADYLCQFAQQHKLAYERDAHNCVVMRKAATAGHENVEPLVLLNHMDMVCVGEPTKPYNALTDAIETEICDGWMHAKGTSLGADNGVGLSIALALIADDSLEHGPLEVLTTTNEEDGMTGAANLGSDFIKGRKVINLDSEDYDTITVGAAGAYMQKATWHYAPTPLEDGKQLVKITIEGGNGGHSGVDIHKGRCNAIKLLGELLYRLPTDDLQIGDLNGGESRASIATKATATLAVSNADKASQLINKIGNTLLADYKGSDNGMCIATTAATTATLLGKADSKAIIETLHNLPFGVLKMREDLPGTVQTSNNIGLLWQTGTTIELTTHTRSFSDTEMESLGKEIARNVQANGGEMTLEANSPAWQENSQSAFIEKVSNAFVNELGFAPKKVAMHFVLEAGYFVRKYPGIEIACIGPRIVSPHSTSERVEMKTVEDILKVAKSLVCS